MKRDDIWGIWRYDQICTGWWFGSFFIFPYIGNNHPNWLIFFRGGWNHQLDQICNTCPFHVNYFEADSTCRHKNLARKSKRRNQCLTWAAAPTARLARIGVPNSLYHQVVLLENREDTHTHLRSHERQFLVMNAKSDYLMVGWRHHSAIPS